MFATKYSADEIYGAASLASNSGILGKALGNGLFAYGAAEQQKSNTLATNDLILSIGLLIGLFRVALIKRNKDESTYLHQSTDKPTYLHQSTDKPFINSMEVNIRFENDELYFESNTSFAIIYIDGERVPNKTPCKIPYSNSMKKYIAEAYDDGWKYYKRVGNIPHPVIQIEPEIKTDKAIAESDYLDRIAKLKQTGELLKDGFITREEFNKIKDKLIE